MTVTTPAVEADATPNEDGSLPRSPRTRPKPGDRDHGELSRHQAGPDASRHSEDVVALLRAERETASKELERAQSARDRANRDIEKRTADVSHYDAMIRAVENAKPEERRR